MAQPTTPTTPPPSADAPASAVATAAPTPGIMPDPSAAMLDAHLGALLDDVERTMNDLAPPDACEPSAPTAAAPATDPTPLDKALDTELNKLQSAAAALVPPTDPPAAAPAATPEPKHAKATATSAPAGAKNIQELDKELAANAKRLVDAAEAKPAASAPAVVTTSSDPTPPAAQPPEAQTPSTPAPPAPAASAQPAAAPPSAPSESSSLSPRERDGVRGDSTKSAPTKPATEAAAPAAPAPEAAPEAPAPKRAGPVLLVARAISFPMAMIPPATRDLVGWAALVTLFQGLCIWAYLFIWR